MQTPNCPGSPTRGESLLRNSPSSSGHSRKVEGRWAEDRPRHSEPLELAREDLPAARAAGHVSILLSSSAISDWPYRPDARTQYLSQRRPTGDMKPSEGSLSTTTDLLVRSGAGDRKACDELTKLAGSHPRPAEVVELMHFGGLTVDRTATELGISRRTALRDWRFARAWLLRLSSPGS